MAQNEMIAELQRLAHELGRPRRVLLVDDNDEFRQSVAVLMEMGKIEVLQANSTEQAMEHLNRKQVDLVITDLKMPGTDGVDLVRAIRERDPVVPPILVMTGYINDRRALDLLSMPGWAAIVPKPISGDSLEQIVNILVRR